MGCSDVSAATSVTDQNITNQIQSTDASEHPSLEQELEESTKETAKESAKETPKESAKETPKESAKETAKESQNETQKVSETKEKKKKKSGEKVIYLTFDDGPGAYTRKLLDVLDKYKVKATFFVTNQFPKYQNLIKEEAKRGHTVAIHSYSHKFDEIYLSEENYFADLEKMQEILEKQGVKRASMIRFPGGSSNRKSQKFCEGIMTALTKDVEEKGYAYCDWNVDSQDSGKIKDTTEIIKNIEEGVKKHNQAVVLQHDIKSYSVDAVEEIIKWGKKNGYKFKTLDQDSVVHHRVRN